MTDQRTPEVTAVGPTSYDPFKARDVADKLVGSVEGRINSKLGTFAGVSYLPDSAHGTNPASSGMIGLQIVQIPSDARGNVDLAALKAACDDTVVGLMLTNPNTLGPFDENIEKVIELVHGCGGLMYGDGANLNALLGIVRPGDLGFDVMHFNLHKTFSVLHGGGGPGVGPVGVAAHLADFLPEPLVGIVEEGEDDMPPLYGFVKPAKTIGRMKAFNGHFGGGFVRSFTYIAKTGRL